MNERNYSEQPRRQDAKAPEVGWRFPNMPQFTPVPRAVGHESDVTFRSQVVQPPQNPRRYVGRTSAAGASGGADRYLPTRGAARPARAVGQAPEAEVRTESRGRAAPWPMRLMVAVSLITGIAAALRLVTIFTSPADDGSGVEATHAAFANLLAGRVGGALDAVRVWPPPAPWHGLAPANPASGLPVFGWMTAWVMDLFGAGDWVGRVVAVGFSLLAGLCLFALVRRTAGARAGLYALLFYSFTPLSVSVGQQFSPGSLLLAAHALALMGLVGWRSSVTATRPRGSGLAFGLALAAGGFAALLDPGAVLLALPAAYIIVASTGAEGTPSGSVSLRGVDMKATALRDAWERSPNRGRLLGYVVALCGAAALWWLFSSGSEAGVSLGVGDGGGGVPAVLAALLNGGTYVSIVGLVIEKIFTLVGMLLLAAGLLQGARPPVQRLFHAWLLASLVHVLSDASRLARHDDVLLPLLLPACALVGIGAAWAGSLPARVWLAVTEHRRESDEEYAVSPHTAWLLDLPEERLQAQPARPQAQLALSRSIAQRAQRAGLQARRTWFMAVGHLAVLAGLGLVGLGGWQTANRLLQENPQATELRAAGDEIAAVTPPGSRLIVAGPYAPQLFQAAGRIGWAVSEDDFGLANTQSLQSDGAAYLLSADQEWLGRQPDYVGLLANYSVAKLSRGYILFDLNVKPSASDRLYFLESGHTLGGEFRRYWDQHGGVQKLGYPISEEVEEASPVDGQTRKVQYFERAILEYHPEFAGKPNSVMLAAVGLWVTAGRDFPRVAPFDSTSERAYFPQTGHSVKETFLHFWQTQGGVDLFGYPISEELPEINVADGKVYTIQYFERARLEWHPTEAGTPDQVQLGLIGKQALQMRK